VEIVTRLSAIICDIIVIILTWHYNYDSYKEALRANVDASLAACVLKDGTMYFIVLTLINVLSMVVDLDNKYMFNWIGFFNVQIPPLLISRFLLNLRQVAYAPDQELGTLNPSFVRTMSTRQFSSLRLATRITGNLDAELDHGPLCDLGEPECDSDDSPAEVEDDGVVMLATSEGFAESPSYKKVSTIDTD